MRRSKKRDHLVDVALKLFYQQGFHATGVDQIVSEAGVARMTLYKHFLSKDDLIIAALERRDDQFRSWFLGEISAEDNLEERVLGVFDALERWFSGKAFPEHSFSGCMFINAAAEFSDLKHSAHQVAAKHKLLLKEALIKLFQEVGLQDADEFVAKILLLKEGAIVTAQVSGDMNSAGRARDIANQLLNSLAATPPKNVKYLSYRTREL